MSTLRTAGGGWHVRRLSLPGRHADTAATTASLPKLPLTPYFPCSITLHPQTTTAGTFSDVIAGAGLPRTVAGGLFSGAYAASSSAAVDSAATSSGYGYGIGQSALTVVTERATAGTGTAPPAPARKANIFKHHLFFKG